MHERFADFNPGYGSVFGIKFPLMEDKDGNISRLYGVDKAHSGHSFRAYFIIDPSQVLKHLLLKCANLHICRLCVLFVVGDLPVALGMDEMMRQVRSLQLAVTGVYVAPRLATAPLRLPLLRRSPPRASSPPTSASTTSRSLGWLVRAPTLASQCSPLST